MKLLLKTLRPNPWRNFDVDPLDDARIEVLLQSINEHGFWGGIVVRAANGGYEIAAGHTRVAAAIKAGIISAEIAVQDIPDIKMIRVYRDENKTQRNSEGQLIAEAGVIAAALCMAILDLLRVPQFEHNVTRSCAGDIVAEKRRANADANALTHFMDGGVGEDRIAEILGDESSTGKRHIRDQLANLKACGQYDKIASKAVKDSDAERDAAVEALRLKAEADAQAAAKAEEARVKAEAAKVKADEAAKAAKAARDAKAAELAEEQAEVAKTRAEAAKREAGETKKAAEQSGKAHSTGQKKADAGEKAKAKAAEAKPTFDYIGVAKILTVQAHVNAFRDAVAISYVSPFLPFEKQAEFAKQMVIDMRSWVDEDGKKIPVTAESITEYIEKLYDPTKREDVIAAQAEARRAAAEAKGQGRTKTEQLQMKTINAGDKFFGLLGELSTAMKTDQTFVVSPSLIATMRAIKTYIREFEKIYPLDSEYEGSPLKLETKAFDKYMEL
jgi:hypothetical protein